MAITSDQRDEANRDLRHYQNSTFLFQNQAIQRKNALAALKEDPAATPEQIAKAQEKLDTSIANADEATTKYKAAQQTITEYDQAANPGYVEKKSQVSDTNADGSHKSPQQIAAEKIAEIDADTPATSSSSNSPRVNPPTVNPNAVTEPTTTAKSDNPVSMLAAAKQSPSAATLIPQNLKGALSPDEKDRVATRLPETVVTASKLPPVKVIENPLHTYPSYTYGITLIMLDPIKYNNLMNKPETFSMIASNNDVLISSGGRYANGERNQYFTGTNFFFEDLNMTTLIGYSKASRNTNAIDLSFKIIEPTGFTLLNRIMKAAAQRHALYLDLPYLIQIDFFAYDDNGSVVSGALGSHTKFIPISLTSFDMSINTEGTVYQISAVAMNETTVKAATIPINIEVKARTVGDMFPRSLGSTQNLADAGGRVEATPNTAGYLVGSSFTDALNTYYQNLKKNKDVSAAEEIDFMFPPEIAEAEIFEANKQSVTNVPMADSQTDAATTTLTMRRVNKGTSIIDLLSNTIQNSSHIRNQQTSDKKIAPGEFNKKNNPVNWFKIVPTVKLLSYNANLGGYVKKTTYVVVVLPLANSVSPEMPYSVPTDAYKEYNYMYTGKNKDVIKFDITLNNLYFTAISVEASNLSKSIVDNNITLDLNEDSVSSEKEQILKKMQQCNAHSPQVNRLRPNDTVQPGTPLDTKAQKGNDYKDTLLNSAQAEMITVDLTIIGDPTFIKQDGFFYNPINTPDLAAKTSSIPMDSGEVFVRLSIKTPTDFDQATGLLMTEDTNKIERSTFSGIYRVLTVANHFRSGKFEQVLTLIRVFGQDVPANSPLLVDAADSSRSVTTAIAGAGSGSAVGAATTALDAVAKIDVNASNGFVAGITTVANAFSASIAAAKASDEELLLKLGKKLGTLLPPGKSPLDIIAGLKTSLALASTAAGNVGSSLLPSLPSLPGVPSVPDLKSLVASAGAGNSIGLDNIKSLINQASASAGASGLPSIGEIQNGLTTSLGLATQAAKASGINLPKF